MRVSDLPPAAHRETTSVTASPHRPRRAAARAVQWLGWLLIAAGTVVLLYLLYSLVFTGRETLAEQARLSDQWELSVGPVRSGLDQPTRAASARRVQPDPPPPPRGAAVAVIEFRRPGSDEPLVHDGPLVVVEGVDAESLRSGPGHYPETALPGGEGNFAVAGHRTTYGAPFFHLDKVRRGDEVLVSGRDGSVYTYEVRRTIVVAPDATWTVRPDPLGNGRPTLTLTTCNPRFSNRERLIVFAQLRARS